MLLGEIRDYLQKRGAASLLDVATRFDIAPDTARFALSYWQRKGKIREVSASCTSGGCGGNNCGGPEATTSYEWVEREVPLCWFPLKP